MAKVRGQAPHLAGKRKRAAKNCAALVHEQERSQPNDREEKTSTGSKGRCAPIRPAPSTAKLNPGEGWPPGVHRHWRCGTLAAIHANAARRLNGDADTIERVEEDGGRS
jgi:hypothetical protein